MERIQLTVENDLREYLLVAPDGVGAPVGVSQLPPALVVLLHGAGGTAAWADGETGWSALAKTAGFALALPEALPPHRDKPPKFLTNPQRWNDGSSGPTGEPPTANDVAFLAAMIADVQRRTPIDPHRIFITGFSNGAGMAFRAAAELAGLIAAVAPVAGYCRIADPRPVRPVPTLYLIGTADPLVPPNGGQVRSPWLHRLIRRPPVAETLERWAVAIGCDRTPILEGDSGGVRTERYPGTTLFRAMWVEGLGHHWPGGKGQLNHRIAGPPSDLLHATTTIWRFFESCPRVVI